MEQEQLFVETAMLAMLKEGGIFDLWVDALTERIDQIFRQNDFHPGSAAANS